MQIAYHTHRNHTHMPEETETPFSATVRTRTPADHSDADQIAG